MIQVFHYELAMRPIYTIDMRLTYAEYTADNGQKLNLRLLLYYIIAAFCIVTKISVFGRISGVCQPYVSRMSVVCQPYVCRMSAVYPLYISRLSAVYRPYVSRMSAVCQPWNGRMSAVYQPYVSRISAVCQPYLISQYATYPIKTNWTYRAPPRRDQSQGAFCA